MSIILEKNQKVNLTKNIKDLNSITIKVEWKSNKGELDLDLYAFMLNFNKKTLKESDLIYIGNLESSDNSIKFNKNDFSFNIDFDKINQDYFEISLVSTVYESIKKNLFFKNIGFFKVKLIDNNTGDLFAIYSFNLNNIMSFDSICFGSIVKRNNNWYFNTENKELLGGVKSFCNIYDITY
jgi:stress response protein SCP2